MAVNASSVSRQRKPTEDLRAVSLAAIIAGGRDDHALGTSGTGWASWGSKALDATANLFALAWGLLRAGTATAAMAIRRDDDTRLVSSARRARRRSKASDAAVLFHCFE